MEQTIPSDPQLSAIEAQERARALEEVRTAGSWRTLCDFYPAYRTDPEFVTAAFRRYREPLAAFDSFRDEVPAEVAQSVREALYADHRAAGDARYAVRIEEWRAKFEELLHVPVRRIATRPEKLVPRQFSAGVHFENGPVLEADLPDGRTFLLQPERSGHYFAAEVYSPAGEFLGSNHDYEWFEFEGSYLK